MTFRRRVLFSLATLVIAPLLFVGIFELALRLAGVGYNPDFFELHSADGTVYLTENHDFARTYFPERLKRHPIPFRVTADKQPGTIRIFVLGASAAQGDPHPDFAFSRALEVQLEAAYPGLDFEVINTALTAVNSHVVRAIAEDSARRDPDLFIVYVGNNEVVGPFGSGTIFHAGLQPLSLIRASIRLQHWRLGQLLAGLLAGGSGPELPAAWAGLEMFEEQTVAFNAPELERTYAQYEANLEGIADVARDAGVPAIFCTVVTNTSRQPPFASGTDSLSSAELASVDDLVRRLQAAPQSVAPLAVETALRKAPDHAMLHFLAAEQERQAGETERAEALFLRARDLDRLRFRADSRLNEVVRRVSNRRPEVLLADLEDAVRAASADGFVGDNWLWEHVHLRPEANSFLARELFPVVTLTLQSMGKVTDSYETAPLEVEESLERLALTAHDQLLYAVALRSRYRLPPLAGQYRNEERISAVEALFARARTTVSHRSAHPEIRNTYEAALARRPDDAHILFQYGLFLMAIRENAAALERFSQAIRITPKAPDLLFKAGQAATMLEQWDDAETYLQRCLEVVPTYPRATVLLATTMVRQGRAEQAIDLMKDEIAERPREPALRMWLLEQFVEAGRLAEAKEQAGALMSMAETTPAMLETIARFYREQGQLLQADRAAQLAVDRAQRDLSETPNDNGAE